MRLYQIPLPYRHNDGTSALPARSRFLAALVHICGGYTLAQEARGAWRNPETGKVYFEAVTPVQFACDDGAWKGREILNAFREAYPDQICAMVADLGEVTFHTLKEEAHV